MEARVVVGYGLSKPSLTAAPTEYGPQYTIPTLGTKPCGPVIAAAEICWASPMKVTLA